MLSFIRPPGFQLNNNNIERLQLLKRSFHQTISFLAVSNYTDSLPIYSSTRCGIPKTKVLGLFPGNSLENLVKLLRNYAKFCEGLAINANCFENFLEPFCFEGLTYKFLHTLNISVSIQQFYELISILLVHLVNKQDLFLC